MCVVGFEAASRKESVTNVRTVLVEAGRAHRISAMARAMPRRMSSWAALLAVLSASWTGLAQGMVQQEGPKTSPETCSIPASLSSFQGEPLSRLTTAPFFGSVCDTFAYAQLYLTYFSRVSLRIGLWTMHLEASLLDTQLTYELQGRSVVIAL